jgi:hypothetical protein
MGSANIVPPFLTSTLDGGEWSASGLCRFTPGERAGWASKSVKTLWRRENSSNAGNGTRAVQPVARHYISHIGPGIFLNIVLNDFRFILLP